MNYLSTLSEVEVEEYQAQAYPESRFSVQDLSGMNGILANLFDKPASWYARVNRIQNELAVLQAEISSIGSAVWNQVQRDLAQALADGQSGGPARFPDYSFAMADLLEQSKAVLVTKEDGWLFTEIKGRVPTDEEIATAESRVPMYRQDVEFVKAVLPELAPSVESDSARVRASVEAAPLRSPGEVGEQAFYDNLKERAKNLTDWSFWLMLGGVAIGIAYLLGRRR